ncbi:MAG: DUF1990 domain-containing protein [Salinibacterium sp.]|nr:DUF1990 domain-containing protein [Salinibacterium sp.]
MELASLTYTAAGATAHVDLLSSPPAGYRPLVRSARLGNGRELFDRAVDSILHWGMQTGSGMRVDGASGERVAVGDTVRLAIPFGPFRVFAPAEVVYLIEEPRRGGFAYGTLPGHPEQGEEAFLVTLDSDDAVTVSVRAFSRPANWFWWLGAPILRITQEIYTRRYLRALA